MKAPFRWEFPVVAVGATLLALVAGANETIALPAATAAVGAAALAVWDSVRGPRRVPGVAAATPEPLPVSGTEQWLRSGPVGQEAIVLLLDRIDRSLVRPDLPNRDAEELAALSHLARDDFLRYLDSRLAELEANS